MTQVFKIKGTKFPATLPPRNRGEAGLAWLFELESRSSRQAGKNCHLSSVYLLFGRMASRSVWR